MIGCRVRCKSWIGSHVVAGCFFGKLERFEREFQLCISQILKDANEYGLNICDPPHWLLPKALCPQFQSGWLAGGNRCFLRKEIGKFCFCINIASKLGKPLRCKSLTCVWQFHCEAVRYMGSGLGRGKWLNHHWFKSFLIIICHHVYLVVEDEKRKFQKYPQFRSNILAA